VVEEKKSASEVGAVVAVTYKDGCVQKLRVMELSDAAHSISWDVIESIPAATVLGVTHTVRLRRVTDAGTTFIEWTTDYSKDASTGVTTDQRFKQKENFAAISNALESKEEVKRAPAKKLIGGMSGVYNPTEAKRGVVAVWEELQALQKASAEATTLTAQPLTLLCARYKKLPITWQIDWKVADLSADLAQKVADEIRGALNTARARLGDNGLPLPRLFGATA